MRVYGTRNNPPQTRMGNVAGYRKAWAVATEYREKWRKWKAGGKLSGQTSRAQPAARTCKAVDSAWYEPRGAAQERGGPGEPALIGQRIAVNAASSDRVHRSDMT